jgi:hypothetical protein
MIQLPLDIVLPQLLASIANSSIGPILMTLGVSGPKRFSEHFPTW